MDRHRRIREASEAYLADRYADQHLGCSRISLERYISTNRPHVMRNMIIALNNSGTLHEAYERRLISYYGRTKSTW